MHGPLTGTLLRRFGHKDGSGRLDWRTLRGRGIWSEEMDQRAGSLPAPDCQFMMGRSTIFRNPPILMALLVLLRTPDDHDLMHDRRQNPILAHRDEIQPDLKSRRCLHIGP